MMPKTDAFLRPYTALPAKAAFFSCRTQSFTKKTPPPHIFRIPLYVAVIKHQLSRITALSPSRASITNIAFMAETLNSKRFPGSAFNGIT